MVSRAEAGVENAPRRERRVGIDAPHVFGDRSRDGVEMAGGKEGRAMPQLDRVVTGRSRMPSPAAQEIDVAFAGEIEAIAIATDKRATDKRACG
jgi:hypothetical protein